MSAADEFSKWAKELANAPVDSDGDTPVGELAWRAMNSIVNDMETGITTEAEAIASSYAGAITWAAFWIAAGAVVVAAIVRFA